MTAPIHSIEAQFAHLRTLGPDWDGMDAAQPRPETIDRAERLVRHTRRSRGKPSRITATPNGTIVVEWQKDGSYLEAELAGYGPVEWMLKLQGKPSRYWLETSETTQV